VRGKRRQQDAIDHRHTVSRDEVVDGPSEDGQLVHNDEQ
jgi:hypothetical protein